MDLKGYLDEQVDIYNTPSFIKDDPVSIPHLFSKKQDIEIAGFFAATFAWGQRVTIIKKSKELLSLMDDAPHEFVLHASDDDLKKLLKFKHRTFNDVDTLYFLEFFKWYYSNYDSLEDAFLKGHSMEERLISFHNLFFSLADHPNRTKKHVATPERKSTCKRINMYLRWMVRDDNCGVDFGLWKRLKPSELICPCDLHVDRIARKLGLIHRKQTDWQTAIQLTNNLKRLDPADPVKYDFALFGLGLEERYKNI